MAAPTVPFAAVSNPGGTGTTITVTLSTHAVNDILFIHIFNTGNTLWAGNPAGWNRLDQRTVGTASTGIVGTWFWRKVVSGDSLPLASPVFTLGATVTRAAICRTVRGADLESPFVTPNYGARAFSTGTANPIRPPSVTTSAPEMLVLNCYGQRTATNAPEPSGYTQDQEVIISGTLVVNASSKTVADQNTVLANQDASPTSGVRWAAATVCIPSIDYPYYRSGSQAATASGTSVTPTKPTGTTNSDVRGNADLMIATVRGSGATTLSAADAGLWTEIASWTLATGGNVTSVKKFWAKATATPNMQFNRTATGAIGACITTYYNCHQTSPISANDADVRTTSTSSTWDAVTRSATKVLVQASSVTDGGSITFTSPSGWIERMDGAGIVCADQIYNATGSSASASFTLSATNPSVVGLVELKGLVSIGATDLVIQNALHAHTAQNLALTQVHALIIQNASHAHTANNLALTQVHSLTIQDASHAHSAQNVALTQTYVLAVQDSSHAHSAGSLTLTQVHSLAVQNAAHGHTANNLALTQVHSLAVQDSLHGHTAPNLALAQTHILVVQSAVHSHTVENLTLTQVHALAIANSSHAHSGENLTLTQVHELAVANSSHAHSADSVPITASSTLTIQNADHGHTSQSLSLTQTHILAVNNAAHAHTAENLTLAAAGDLVIQNATHGHTSDSLVLTQSHNLAVASASHGHSVENLSLTQVHVLTVQSGAHGHSAENVVLEAAGTLQIQNATHSHSAESLTLSQVHSLTVSGASHSHTVENAVLTQAHALVTQGATHGHTTESPTLTETVNLNISSGLHSHSADELGITQVHSLTINGSIHGHVAQNLTLGSTNDLLIASSVHGHLALHVYFAFPVGLGDNMNVPVGSGASVAFSDSANVVKGEHENH